MTAGDEGGGKSDMNGWTDGVAYTDLTIVQNQYCQATTGKLLSYTGWDRTGYVPCAGASTITFPPMPQADRNDAISNWFYKADKTPLAGGRSYGFKLNNGKTMTVPTDAAYFIISSDRAALASCVNAGIVPHA